MSSLRRLLMISLTYKNLDNDEQLKVEQILTNFINKYDKQLSTGFYPLLLANTEDIDIQEAIKCLIVGTEIGLFKLYYEVRCPDCDNYIETIDPENEIIDENYIFECQDSCMESNEGEPVEKKITTDDYIPYFIMNIDTYNKIY